MNDRIQRFVASLLEDEEIVATSPAKANPLDGRSKVSAKNLVYKTVGHIGQGFFTDNHWAPVKDIMQAAADAGFSINVTGTQYLNNEQGVANAKVWRFEIPFVNQRGKEDRLYGNITASGAGSVDDPLGRYDVTFIAS